MLNKKKILAAVALLFVALVFAAPPADARPSEYKAIVNHLKSKYRAKKVKIPFMWLARAVVSVARPAGVKSFSITVFEDLKFSRETLDEEMQSMMRKSFDKEWIPILRVRSRTGEQVYMYMREAGASVKLTVVTIDNENAAVIRATLNPDKLAEFMNDPKVFGFSLNDADRKDSESKDLDKDDDKEN
jgi:hypothetical protein